MLLASTTFSSALPTFRFQQQFTFYDYANWRTELIISTSSTISNLGVSCVMSYLSTLLRVVAKSLRSSACEM